MRKIHALRIDLSDRDLRKWKGKIKLLKGENAEKIFSDTKERLSFQIRRLNQGPSWKIQEQTNKKHFLYVTELLMIPRVENKLHKKIIRPALGLLHAISTTKR